jgi:hypothetical protein
VARHFARAPVYRQEWTAVNRKDRFATALRP